MSKNKKPKGQQGTQKGDGKSNANKVENGAQPAAVECKFTKIDEPKLRHEFVGMMFAVTIAEVGLQFASLVKYEGSIHFLLPAYSHLILATIVIAASWVGWTLSPSPGARNDVKSIFTPEFLVLLIDVALVICYFVLVRLVDLEKSESGGRVVLKVSAVPESSWILVIFVLYLIWDCVTKFLIRRKESETNEVKKSHLLWRFVPTIACCGLAWLASWQFVEGLSASQVVIADLALLSLVLFFRAAKAVISAFWPSEGPSTTAMKVRAVFFALISVVSFGVCLIWVKYWPTDFLEDFINKVKPPKDVSVAVSAIQNPVFFPNVATSGMAS